MVINITEKRYKLHLTYEDLESMKETYDSHDWLCDCKDFPNCEDYKRFKKLKMRVSKLEERSEKSKMAGHEAHRKLKTKYMIEGRNI